MLCYSLHLYIEFPMKEKRKMGEGSMMEEGCQPGFCSVREKQVFAAGWAGWKGNYMLQYHRYAIPEGYIPKDPWLFSYGCLLCHQDGLARDLQQVRTMMWKN